MPAYSRNLHRGSFRHVLTACPRCSSRLKQKERPRRTIETLSYTFELRDPILGCTGDGCDLPPYRPELHDVLALPGTKYGIDVVVAVGCARARLSISRVISDLSACGLRLAREQVSKLADRYEELLRRDRIDPGPRPPDLVLVHGVCLVPEAPMLVVIRDVIGRKVMAARWCAEDLGQTPDEYVDEELKRLASSPRVLVCEPDRSLRRMRLYGPSGSKSAPLVLRLSDDDPQVVAGGDEASRDFGIKQWIGGDHPLRDLWHDALIDPPLP